MKIVIIGSGLSGTYLANRLSSLGHSVILLEKGNDLIKSPNDLVFLSREFGLKTTHSWNIGGTTALWHGGIMPLSYRETITSKLQHIGIEKYYEKVIPFLLNSKNPFINNSNVKKEIDNCLSEVCIAIPKIPQRFTPTNNVDTRINVKNISFFSDSGKLKKIVFTQEKKETIDGIDLCIMSAGGLGTPTLLTDLVENDNTGRNLIDHPMGFIGKIRFNDNNNLNTRDLKGKALGIYNIIRTGFSVHDKEKNLNHCFYLRPSYSMDNSCDLYIKKKNLSTYRMSKNFISLLKEINDIDIIAEIFSSKIGINFPTRTFSILVVSEQIPDKNRFVERNQDQRIVNWYFRDDEILSINKSIEKLIDYLSPYIDKTNISFDETKERLWSAAHFSGTCRISDSPREGVVDSNLKIHDLENVYICDGSALPKTGYSNTGVTIIALAERLVDHIQAITK